MRIGLNEEICEKLQKTLPKHKRQGRGGFYTYCKGSDVIRCLNEAFNHSWSSERVDVEVIEQQVLMLVSVAVYIEGDTITHHGYGSASIKDMGGEVGNAYKAAYTSALKKAAEQFGIGLGQDDEEDVPSRGPSTAPQQPVVKPTPKPSFLSSRPLMESPKPLPNRSGKGGGNPPTGNVPVNLLEAAARLVNGNAHSEKLVKDVPSLPVKTVPVAAPVSMPEPTSVSEPTPTPDLGDEPITSIQETALNSLSKMRGKSEVEMIKGGLPETGKTTFKGLLKSEAIKVIRYANHLPMPR